MVGLQLVLAVSLVAWQSDEGNPPQELELLQHIADSTAFHVNSVVVVGPTEAILIDTQFLAEDAHRVADQIEDTGKRLTAIFITHPDHDHFSGAAVIVERFPGTPVYMTAAAVEHFENRGREDFAADKSRRGDTLADSVVTPQVLPSTTFTVDGAEIVVLPDLQGDVLAPLNSVVWIPSMGTLIAGDVLFNGVHVWLGASNAASRAAWRADLTELIELGAATVIAGHKPTPETPDSPAAFETMIRYLADFDEALAELDDGGQLAERMERRYPWKVAGLVRYSANAAFEKRPD